MNPQFVNSGMQNQMSNIQRRNELSNHLDHMKHEISNIGMGVNMGLNKEQIEQPAHILYQNIAPNVIRRSHQNENVQQNNYKNHEENNTSLNSSDESSKKSNNSDESSKKSNSSDENSNSINSEISDSKPKKNIKIEKSLSSKNNYSTISKRKYKKSGISIDTS